MKKHSEQDFTKYLSESMPSHKDRLITTCQKRGVSIYADDATETSSGAYAALRAVASEAELERRLNASKSVGIATGANVISLIALFVSIIALAKSFL